MIAAAWIKARIASWALVAARHVLRDAQFVSAGVTEYRELCPFFPRTDLDRMARQSLVTLLARKIQTAAMHLDGNNIESGSIVSAASLRIQIASANFRTQALHR